MTITRTTGVALAGAILAAVGTVLPWVTANAGLASLSRSGLELGGDAQILAAAAVVGALGIVWGKPAGIVLAIVAGFVAMGIGYVDWQDIQARVATLDPGTATVGPGIWVSLLGGVLLTLGAFAAWREGRAVVPPAPPSETLGD